MLVIQNNKIISVTPLSGNIRTSKVYHAETDRTFTVNNDLIVHDDDIKDILSDYEEYLTKSSGNCVHCNTDLEPEPKTVRSETMEEPAEQTIICSECGKEHEYVFLNLEDWWMWINEEVM